ncbi:MAG: ABC transporter permease subunit, partial [Erysipelotrichaceae bacterium]|nr:ABC transporter permease subunit [Erysipelotrichaceae bacterium]
SSNQFMPMLQNSLVSTTLATLISITIAFGLAWCLNRCRVKYKAVLTILFTLPMLIPSISHGMGLTILFGDNGIFTNLTGININLYGLVGIIMGATLYAFPVAFLMFNDMFSYEDYTVYEVAKVLGLSKFQQFIKITLPNLRKTLITCSFAIFTMIFTDYGVPLVVGGKYTTLPVYMYREVIGLLDYSKGAVLGVILLVPAIIAFVIDLYNKDNNSMGTLSKKYAIEKNPKRDIIANIVCIAAVLIIALPIVTYILLCFINKYPIDMSLTFNNIKEAMKLGVFGYLLNSLFIAMATALIGTAISYVCAFYTAIAKKEISSGILHFIALTSLSIPGIVLGLSYVIFFQGSIIYGTFVILISVNITHFFASPYLLAYNALSKFDDNLIDVAGSLGIPTLNLLKDVYFPSMYDTVLEMFGYIFVNAMVTISAVSFLANFKTMPIALLIPQFDSQSLIGAIAFISIIILLVNCMMKVLIHYLKTYYFKKGNV